jgi:hypothetical protein
MISSIIQWKRQIQQAGTQHRSQSSISISCSIYFYQPRNNFLRPYFCQVFHPSMPNFLLLTYIPTTDYHVPKDICGEAAAHPGNSVFMHFLLLPGGELAWRERTVEILEMIKCLPPKNTYWMVSWQHEMQTQYNY